MRELAVTIDRFESDRAIMITDDRSELVIPRSLLPRDAGAGQSFIISISEQGATEHENLAKKILNEIIKKKG